MKRGILATTAAMIGAIALSGTSRKQPPVLKKERKQKPKRASQMGWSFSAQPEYYGKRKQPIKAENKHGEIILISVKNALKKGFKLITLPQ